ncbi:hypothetical protein RQM65_01805 [Pricia sp. S334]|uniref:Uncharacterized protein n=1 Tax=Pricia mediterranea TaxID=3076079 RepID=A0ABU3L122_9FLAO|nr:hypothetical protein [Pricia sp. S334]MDT7827396.1 hypothetical protein [Pricia sp. S334]
MIENLQFLHQVWLWPILLGGSILWLVFLWKEYLKKPSIRFFANGLVALIGIIALMLMALRPAILHPIKTKAGALLTDAYSEQQLDSLRNSYDNLRVIPYRMNRDIRSALDSTAPLFVLGDGVRPFDFWQFDGVSATYLQSETPEGIIGLNYKRKVAVGEDLSVRGRFNAPKKGHRLVLATSGGTGLDSVLLDSSLPDSTVQSDIIVARRDFLLSTEMKAEGNSTYSLIEKDSTGKIIQSEPLPVTVTQKKPLKVLLVNSFPTFESKYLKNYLARMGHELTVRSRLTKGKYKFEYFNTGKNPIYALSRTRLEAFDVLIIDSQSYLNLSGTSENALKEAILKDGLGIFIQPNDGFLSASKSKSGFDFVRGRNRTARLERWPELKMDTYPFRFSGGAELEGIYRNEREILVAYRRLEMGRIGTTLIQNTYSWILDGHPRRYQEFWSEIIEKISKREDISTRWSSSKGFAILDMPYDFELRSVFERPEIVGDNGGEIPIRQHPDMPELWTGTVYPRTTGWNGLRIRNDSTAIHRFFVMDSLDYGALTRHGMQRFNTRFFDGATSNPIKSMKPRPVPAIWFYMVFLTAIGWLWLWPKLLRQG